MMPREAPLPNPPNTSELDLLAAVTGAAVVWWVSRRPTTWTLEQHFNNPLTGCFSVHDKSLALAIRDWCEHNYKKERREQAEQKRVAKKNTRRAG